jgi:hypothetical protein
MRVLVLGLVVAAGMSSSATGDSCVTLEQSAVINRCQACMKVTIQEIRPPGEQAAEIYRGEPRLVRVESGGRVRLQEGQRFAIIDLSLCD